MDHPLATDIADTLTDLDGVDRATVERVLTEQLDAETLDRLDRDDTPYWTLSIALPERNVTITSDGGVVVTEPPAAFTTAPSCPTDKRAGL